jgi:hypothetical protein
MTIEIRHRYSGQVIFTATGATTIAEAVVMAVTAGANLDGANLNGANLYRASLDGANLYRASLNWASLDGANLYRANLYRASLDGANLDGANLNGANLDGASLDGASLYRANLENVKGLAYQIPQEGELIVWKAVAGGVCKLRVPPEAKRTATPIGRKCRAEWVEVLDAPKNGRGLHDSSVIYRAGEIVRPDKYDPDPRLECTHGIHFFLTREEAEAYR